ncbi:MAG: sulfite exporter TauE/SafE family protein [Actinomycetota bacterium]
MPAHAEIELLIVVALFATAQSIFGVGLLVFGTPTLLLLGFSFSEILAYLLPCSILISALQVRKAGGVRPLDTLNKRFLMFTAPGVLVGTVVILAAGSTVSVKPIVGAMLVITAALRSVRRLREGLETFVRRHLSKLLIAFALGVVHGLSNLGGGILTVIVGSLFDDKENVRKHIAFAYGLMAIVQLVTLIATTDVMITWWLWLALPTLAAAMFFLVGQRLFEATPQSRFQPALTALVLTFGLALMIPT